jgi:hypothetical protein
VAVGRVGGGQLDMAAVRFEAQLEAGTDLRIDLYASERSSARIGTRSVAREIVGDEMNECGVHCRFKGAEADVSRRVQTLQCLLRVPTVS